VHVADDVERAMFVPPICPHRLPHNFQPFQFFGRFEDMNTTETFPFESTERPP
jgi:hypothetical protein